MGYRLSKKDRSATHALWRIARAQLDGAITAIDAAEGDTGTAVHDVRKRCKKVRSLLRLMRPAFDGYREASDALRDAARRIAPLRDAAVRVATYDALVARYGAQIDRRALGSVRRLLILRHHAMDEAGGQDRLADCRRRLGAVREGIDDWTLDADGFEAFEGGLRRTWRSARQTMETAGHTRTADDLHRWRKRCKDHWYQARLLQPIWPGPMDAHIAAARAAGDRLGEHHDLAVLLDAIHAAPARFDDRADVDVLTGLAGTRQDTLLADALSCGRRLFADKPSALVRAWGLRYDLWRVDAGAD